MRSILRAAALVLLSTTGCVWATKVKGPEGKEAFRIHCSTPDQCSDKAAEVCAGDYDVVSSTTEVDGYAKNGTGYANSPHERVITCRDGGGQARPASPPPRAPAAAEPVKEVAACAAAKDTVKDTAAFWGQLFPEAKRLPEPPAEKDFAEVCRALPERVQRCLDARYRQEHDKPCLAILKRLEPGEKNKIDSLFLE